MGLVTRRAPVCPAALGSEQARSTDPRRAGGCDHRGGYGNIACRRDREPRGEGRGFTRLLQRKDGACTAVGGPEAARTPMGVIRGGVAVLLAAPVKSLREWRVCASVAHTRPMHGPICGSSAPIACDCVKAYAETAAHRSLRVPFAMQPCGEGGVSRGWGRDTAVAAIQPPASAAWPLIAFAGMAAACGSSAPPCQRRGHEQPQARQRSGSPTPDASDAAVIAAYDAYWSAVNQADAASSGTGAALSPLCPRGTLRDGQLQQVQAREPAVRAGLAAS